MAENKNFVVSSPEPPIQIPAKALPEYLLHKAELHSENEEAYFAIDATSQEKRYFSQFETEKKKIASKLYKLGLRKGNVVIYLPSEMIKLHVFLASVWRANGICHASYPDDTPATLVNRVKESNCAIILCDKSQTDKVKDTVANVGWPVEIITTEDHPGYLSVNNILQTDNGESCPSLQVSVKDLALILCTSGTTGLSKGAVLTHSALVEHIEQLSHLPYTKNKPNVMFSTATHYTGTVLTFSIMVTGKTAVLTGKVSKELLWKTINDLQPGCAFAFPTYLMSMLSPEAKDFDFSSLDLIITAGAVVTPAIRNVLLQLPNVTDIFNLYGMTECGILCTNAVLKKNPEQIAYKDTPDFSVGKPKPGTLIQIRDIDTLEPLGANQKGELCAHNNALLHSYLNNPEATKKAYIDGYLRTGDIGYYDDNGFIYVVDRVKEIFKYYNFHICPTEVENVIAQHPLVNEVCVVAIPDPGGFVPRAFVTVKENKSPTLKDDIIEFVHSILSPYKHIRGGLHIVSELPKGKTGKIDRALVADMCKVQA